MSYPGAGTASPITLASLNLHGGMTSHGAPFDVAEACYRLKADVITLQEAWRPEARPDAVTEVAAALGAGCATAGSPGTPAAPASESAPTTSRAPGAWPC